MTTTISRRSRLKLANLAPERRVTIYTVQETVDLDRLLQRGRIGGEFEYGEREGPGESHWRPAYDWMRGQMAERIIGFTGEYPIWAWVRAPRYRGEALRAVKGLVRIKAKVPRGRMVLSCFDLWHHPLNKFSIDEDEASMEAMWNAPIEEKAKTWHKCLDLSDRSGWAAECFGQVNVVQACVDGLSLDEVVDVTAL